MLKRRDIGMDGFYRAQHRDMQNSILELAEKAESKGFPLLANDILGYCVEIYNTPIMYRVDNFASRMHKFQEKLWNLNTAWHNHPTLIKPALFEIKIQGLEITSSGFVRWQ